MKTAAEGEAMITYATAELTRQALDKARPTLGDIAEQPGKR